MAGLFSSNRYSRPGKGVDETNAYGKPGVKLFFSVLGRKLTSFIGLNFLFVLFSIPFIILSFYFYSGCIFGVEVSKYFGVYQSIQELFFKFTFALLSVFVPVLSFGPAYMGVYFVLRQFSREKHAYVWWDFRDIMVQYIKKGIVVSLINIVVFFIMSYAFYMYVNFLIPSLALEPNSFSSWISYILLVFLGIMMIVYFIISIYIYPILCSYDLSVVKSYKLAYTFSLLKLPQNFLIFIVDIILFVLLYLFMPIQYYWISIVLTLLIFPILIAYINTFCVDAMMRKLDPNIEAQANNRVDQYADD